MSKKRCAVVTLESYEEEAQRLAARAEQKRNKGRLLYIAYVTKNHVETIQPVLKTLRQMGYKQEEWNPSQACQTPVKKELPSVKQEDDEDDIDERGEGDYKNDDDDEPGPGASGLAAAVQPTTGVGTVVAELETDLPDNVKVLQDLPPDALKKIAMHMEPTVWSANNLKYLLPNQRMRYIRKQPLLAIVVFNTSLNENEPVNEEMRNLRRLCDRAKELHVANGRRGKDFPIPMQYDKDGHYVPYEEAGRVYVKVQWLHGVAPVVLDPEDFPTHTLNSITVIDNHSLRAAVISNSQTGAKEELMMLFGASLSREFSTCKLVPTTSQAATKSSSCLTADSFLAPAVPGEEPSVAVKAEGTDVPDAAEAGGAPLNPTEAMADGAAVPDTTSAPLALATKCKGEREGEAATSKTRTSQTKG